MANPLETLISSLNENVSALHLSIKQLGALLDEPAKGVGGQQHSLAWRLNRFLSMAQFNYSSSVVVGTTATPIAGRNPYRVELLIYNNGSVVVYVGSAQVSTVAGDSHAGIPIATQTGLAFDRTGGEFWGITASGTADLRILEQSATELAHQDRQPLNESNGSGGS